MSKITQVSDELIERTKLKEGFNSKPYPDPIKIPTIGYGTTKYFDTKKKVTLKDKPISLAEGDRLLRGWFSTIVSPLVDRLIRDDVDQYDFDAIADFIYNAGATYKDSKGIVRNYNLFDKINKKVPRTELEPYWENLATTANHVKLKGLIIRRKEEVNLYYKKLDKDGK